MLGHLGSSAEFGLAGLDAAQTGADPPERETFPAVWARWDAMRPEERRDAFVAWDEQLVTRYEALDDDSRTTLRIKLGFLPSPMDVPSIVSFRLTETALHSWDVRAGTDPAATLDPPAAALLVDRLPLSIGFFGRPDALPDADHGGHRHRRSGPRLHLVDGGRHDPPARNAGPPRRDPDPGRRSPRPPGRRPPGDPPSRGRDRLELPDRRRPLPPLPRLLTLGLLGRRARSPH